MKKITVSVALAISVIPFAFYKMEGPYYQDAHPEKILEAVQSNNKSLVQEPVISNMGIIVSGIDSLFMYNPDTGFAIFYNQTLFDSKTSEEKAEKIVSEFNKVSYLFENGLLFSSEDDIAFVFVKEQSNLKTIEKMPIEVRRSSEKTIGIKEIFLRILKGCCCCCRKTKRAEINEMEQLKQPIIEQPLIEKTVIKEEKFATGPMNSLLVSFKNHYHDELIDKVSLPDEVLNAQEIKLSQEFQTSSSVLVSNKDGYVEISKNGKTVNFKESLKTYLNNLPYSAVKPFVKLATNSLRHPLYNKRCEQDLIYGEKLIAKSQKQLMLLNKSNILHVFAAIKDEYEKDSIIWGLAEDKETGKKFHWITELKDDISVLINQYS